MGKETENFCAAESGGAGAGAARAGEDMIAMASGASRDKTARRAEVHENRREGEIILSVLRLSGLDAMGDRGSRKAVEGYCVLRRGGRKEGQKVRKN